LGKTSLGSMNEIENDDRGSLPGLVKEDPIA
jgi:hypothetical protein